MTFNPNAHARMSVHAPRKCSYELGTVNGVTKYSTREWTVEDVKSYKEIGGWFAAGKHEFANLAASKAAFNQGDE